LSDPDHLPTAQVNALYNHWLNRQNNNLSPFIILNAGPLHVPAVKKSAKAKGKQKQPYEDVKTDDEDEDGNSESGEEGRVNDGAGEDSGKEEEEEEGEEHPPAKLGPPNGKQDAGLHIRAAGPSSKPPPKSGKATATRAGASSKPAAKVKTFVQKTPQVSFVSGFRFSMMNKQYSHLGSAD